MSPTAPSTGSPQSYGGAAGPNGGMRFLGTRLGGHNPSTLRSDSGFGRWHPEVR